MPVHYAVDFTRTSLQETLWSQRNPLAVAIATVMKLTGQRVPCSSDDPPVDSVAPFLVEALPEEFVMEFAGLEAELAGLGFVDPVYHVAPDPIAACTVYWASYRSADGRYMARIHQRVWPRAIPQRRGLYVMLFTRFTDGGFLVSSSGKPDMLTPKTVQMNRMPKASVPALWERHTALTAKEAGQRTVAALETRDDLVHAIEQHHVLIRDFQVARRVFRLPTKAELSDAEAHAAAVESGLENPAVLVELDKLQDQKSDWQTALLLLGVSAAAFLLQGSAQKNLGFTLWLIPILFFHEAGHWLAMKIFGYKNLRMFFIPGFGAAVTGRRWNVPGWKRALVALAGPLPGIVVGSLIALAGVMLEKPQWTEGAFIMLILNAFNLLPLLPMDGGHVVQAVLFCRNRWLDVAFRVAAIAGLLGLTFAGGGSALRFVAIGMAVGLPTTLRLGRVADQLRGAALPTAPPDSDRIPVETAQVIVRSIQEAMPKNARSSAKVIAQQSLLVFQALNARPPGFLATTGILGLHFGGLLVAAVAAVAVAGFRGGLWDGLAFSTERPKPVHCGDARLWTNGSPAGTGAQTVMVLNTDNAETAKTSFEQVGGLLDPSARMLLFGASVLVSAPQGDAALGERILVAFQRVSTNAFTAPSNQPVAATFLWRAPAEADAAAELEELTDYLAVAPRFPVLTPWSPEAADPSYASYRGARRKWSLMQAEVGRAATNPAVTAMIAREAAARSRGENEPAAALENAGRELRRIQIATAEGLVDDPRFAEPAGLAAAFAKLTKLSVTNLPERATVMDEATRLMGRAPSDMQTSGGDRFLGFAFRNRKAITLAISLGDPLNQMPQILNWLCSHGAQSIRYSVTEPIDSGDSPTETEDHE